MADVKSIYNIGEGFKPATVGIMYLIHLERGVYMVYVLNSNGSPLMPTNRHGKVKHLLKDGKATVVKRTPFTIQLSYNSTEFVQPITLGVDAGSKVIGISATTQNKEVYASEIEVQTSSILVYWRSKLRY